MTLDNKIINFDINRNNLFDLTAKQYDTDGARSFTFRLLKDSIPFDLTGLSVKVGGKKPDGKDIFNDCKVIDSKKGIVELELTTQMQVIVGTLNLELLILNGETRLSTIPFEVQIIKSVTDFKEVESSNEFGALNNALNVTTQYADKLKEETENIEFKYTKKLNKIDSQLSEKVDLEYNLDLEEIINKINKNENTFDIKNMLMGMPSKKYTEISLEGNPIITTDGKSNVNNASTLTDYFYGNKHLKFGTGIPKVKNIELNNNNTTILSKEHSLEKAIINLDDNFTLFFKNIKVKELSGVQYLANIDNNNNGYRIRINNNIIEVEFRINNLSSGYLTTTQQLKVDDEFNLSFAKNGDNFNLSICINNNLDSIEVLKTTKNKCLTGECFINILDYNQPSLNLQSKCSYNGIYLFNRYIPEQRALVLQNNYIKYEVINDNLTNIKNSDIIGSWNEKICGEVCNILHEPNDVEKPYKIAVGGYNGEYTNELKGKTNFAYSTDLINWMYISDVPPIDIYTEDGCLVKFRGKYYYYAETMPNRNTELWISSDFKKWDYIGKVASPDNDSYLKNKTQQRSVQW
ncbi:BppU family phage baseplate upper protein [Clostridium perfringens]|uniref:BppU family phage baseplate upper protein n=1 Tax=Clostridium perfringens TaxID=1502 RepID=UPI000DF0F7C5|nr:BppU family phage baseplate upper protein [Clostridium perfringens]STB59705.1 metallo-beta-lactamase [Clostridium perfringens]